MSKLLVVLFLVSSFSTVSAEKFHDYFSDKACRVDLNFCGNATRTEIYLAKIKKEPFWGGRRNQLDRDLNLGDFRYRILDSISNKQIFIDGFSALYREWQTTPEAKISKRCFEQSIQFPFPLHPFVLIIEKRCELNKWEELYRLPISVNDKLIDCTLPEQVPVKVISKTLASDKALDIAIIAEGYTQNEEEKFYRDAQQLFDNLITHEPFGKYKNRINIYAIAAISIDSGISKPQNGDWKNTAIGSHFFTFYEPRYLTSPNVYKIRDLAALVPYDAIYILANTKNYGGGGIYNFYALTAADNELSKYVTVHEFGHSLAGLGDEYFKENADVLDGMYNLKIEPWEPNITSLVEFDKKWKDQLPESYDIPTKTTQENKTRIGVFEGGGYLTKGMYRAHYDCRMRTNKSPEFCSVCQKAIEKTIIFLTE